MAIDAEERKLDSKYLASQVTLAIQFINKLEQPGSKIKMETDATESNIPKSRTVATSRLMAYRQHNLWVRKKQPIQKLKVPPVSGKTNSI